MTAHYLNIPMVVVRRVSQIGANALSVDCQLCIWFFPPHWLRPCCRALPVGSRVLLVDDFMRAGGTLRGLMEPTTEFESEVVGMGVLIEMELASPEIGLRLCFLYQPARN